MTEQRTLDQKSINTIRFLAADAVQKAQSGHPGTPMGAATMAYTLWDRFLKHNPANPNWPDRDRFALSPGHASMLLYALLHLTGYDLSLDEIESFRQWGSKTPGHPEYGETPGVEMRKPEVTVYGAHWCPDCRRSKQFLGKPQIPYERRV